MARITAVVPFFLVALVYLSTNVVAYCKNFKQSRNYYTITSPDEQIISKGYICDVPNSNYISPTVPRCNSTGECPAVTQGIVSTVGSNNLSLSHDEVLPLYALIPTKTFYVPPFFPYSLSGNITSANSCLSAHTANGSVDDTTTAGYFSFVPTLLCIEGRLNQCEDGPVEDETAIQLCAVNTLDLGARGIVPNGVQKWVDTDVETAKNMTRNPALTAEAVPYEVGVSLEELGISFASRVITNWRTWWIGLSVALGLIW
ncbi:putative secreted effector protein [Golovinomyces cichoracearum]|uniref:Putative secreted effector protein n=1 Tax=Golovinomyces cichoracearum TaxID=62708 RepID=A0A420IN22_9PEZI|nr:putative secreted effector protein [Golovinomyces cichoracearum]